MKSLRSATPKEQLEEIKLGSDGIISEEELLKKLEGSYEKKTPLTIKFGADPSRPDIHLGHTVVLNKLKLFQDFGHKVIFIIGDFTARIGDPTGRNKARPELSEEEVQNNSLTYKEQMFKILDPESTQVVYNSQWLGKLSSINFIRLMSERTLQQIIAREDFAKRYAEENPIFFHELTYPLLQGYDSVVLKSDVELGGTDQMFNLLMGRELQRHKSQRPQSILMMPLLEGLDGVLKMSKSYDNYISLTDSPKDMFGKTMSISDTHMMRFYQLISRKGARHVDFLEKSIKDGTTHPMQAKKDLAEEIVCQYWGIQAGKKAREEFEELFSKKEIPEDLQEHQISADENGMIDLVSLSVALGFSASKSEARRVLKQNGIKIDQEAVSTEKVSFRSGMIFRQGKLKMVRLV